jgi:hypothetical protein
MKRIVQKSKKDCAICVIAMVTGVPYATVKRVAKKRAGYSPQKNRGTSTHRVNNIIEEIGSKAYPSGDGSFFNMSSALKGRKGILMWRDNDPSNNLGHAVAWDGFRVVCPGADSKPKERIETYNSYLENSNKEWCELIGVPTPMYQRVASLVYCFFPRVYLETKTEIKDDYKRASNLLRKACVSTSKYISIFTRSMVCRFRLKKSTKKL